GRMSSVSLNRPEEPGTANAWCPACCELNLVIAPLVKLHSSETKHSPFPALLDGLMTHSTFFPKGYRKPSSMPTGESVSHHDLVVCASEGQEYTARDGIDAAIFRGELEIKWKEFLQTVEAERYSDE